VSLKDSAKKAILWSAGLNLFRDGLQFVQMLVMVRLLDPDTYGMANYGSTLISFIGLVSFQHISAHIVQVRSKDDIDYDQHFTFGLFLNLSLFVLTNIIAFGSAYVGQYAKMQPILHVLSFTFIFSVPMDLRQRMLERQHHWEKLRPLQMAMMLVSVLSGIFMALAGAGVYALIVPGILSMLVFSYDLFIVLKWRPRWTWNRHAYKDALHFGVNRIASNVMNSGRKMVESTSITHYFQFSGLGVFGRAEGLANMFCGRIGQQVVAALYPIITRTDPGSERFQKISGLVLRSVAWVIIPIAVWFSFEASAITNLLYGNKWNSVITLLPLTMLIGAAQALGGCAYSLLLANEARRQCIRSDVFAMLLIVACVLALMPMGLKTYLMGASAAHIVIGLVLITLLVRTDGIKLGSLMAAIFPPLLAAGLGVIVMQLVRNTLWPSAPLIIQTLIAGLIFGSIYTLVIRQFFRDHLRELLDYMPAGQWAKKLLVLA
jgi:O-antigen/teichoic acid export membrane protein